MAITRVIGCVISVCVLVLAASHAGSQQPTPDKKKSVVIAALADTKGHGHVVVQLPGSDRVWDGNTLGGLKDLKGTGAAAGQVPSNHSVMDRMYWFLKNEFPNDLKDVTRPPKDAPEAEKTAYYDKLRSTLDAASADQRTNYLDAYVDRGAAITQSWSKDDLKNVKYYHVPVEGDVKEAIKQFTPPAAKTSADENLRCNALVLKVAPALSGVVSQELGKDKPASANNIAASLDARSQRTSSSGAAADIGTVSAGTTTCPRCNGSGYVDWSDIDRLGMRGSWLPGGCRLCGGAGRATPQQLRQKDVRSKIP